MKHSLLALSLLAVPTMAFALDSTDSSIRYTDSASFSRSERAGISFLTNIGAVSGNPDGSFAAARTLNRAEFLKIILEIAPDDGSILEGDMPPGDGSVSSSAAWCFPDVHAGDWFMPYVCTAKQNGIVEGYPDGLFHPERAVNYAEAIKMLTLLYQYNFPDTSGDPRWYLTYFFAAYEEKVLLSEHLDSRYLDAYGYFNPEKANAGMLLTRGQMARLAAAFRAEHDGELDAYRAWESGQSSSRTSSTSSTSVSSESSSSSISSSVSVSSVASSQTALFPAVSHFLMFNETTPTLLDGTFVTNAEDEEIRYVHLKLRRQIKSLKSLTLIDETGASIATLKLATGDNASKLIWEVFTTSGAHVLPKNKSNVLGIKAVLKDFGDGAVSNELFEVERFYLSVRGVESALTREIVPINTHYPMHQTAQADLQAVRSLLPITGTVQQGEARQIGSFAVSGTSTGGTLMIDGMQFYLRRTNVNVTNIRIGGATDIDQTSCGIETTDVTLVFCAPVPENLRTVGSAPRVLSIYATLSVGSEAATGTVQLEFIGHGKIGQAGGVQWGDGTSRFNWIEADVPLENAPQWTVTK